MKKITEHMLKVTPIDHEKLAKYLEEIYRPEPNQRYTTEYCALVCENVMTDNECCYWFIEKKAHNGKLQFVYSAPVRVITKTDEGESFPMTPSFYVDISTEDLKPYMKDKCTLREYMARRYNYNPRISANMRDFLKEINDSLPESVSAQTGS